MSGPGYGCEMAISVLDIPGPKDDDRGSRLLMPCAALVPGRCGTRYRAGWLELFLLGVC